MYFWFPKRKREQGLTLHNISKRTRDIKYIKFITRLTVGLAVSLYLATVGLSSVPALQRMAGEYTSSLLERLLTTKVHIGGVRMGMMGRLIIDDMQVYDRSDTLMLDVARMAAKIDLKQLAYKRIKIYNAQLIGVKARVYQKEDGGELNCKFLIDAFSGKDSADTSHPDLSVETLILRRSTVRWDRYHRPETPDRLCPDHIEATDISLTAQINQMTQDTIDVYLKKLSLSEKSGFALHRATFRLKAGCNGAWLSKLAVDAMNSSVLIPEAELSYPTPSDKTSGKEWAKRLSGTGCMSVDISLADARYFTDALPHATEQIHAETSFSLRNGNAALNDIYASTGKCDITMTASATLRNIFSSPECSVNIESLCTSPEAQSVLLGNIYGNTGRRIDVLDRLGATQAKGTADLRKGHIQADIDIKTDAGRARLKGSLKDKDVLHAEFKAEQCNAWLLAGGDNRLGTISLEGKTDGHLKGLGKTAKLTTAGTVTSFEYNGYTHRNIPYSVTLSGRQVCAEAEVKDRYGNLTAHMEMVPSGQGQHLRLEAGIEDFCPHSMNLTANCPEEKFGARMLADIDFSGIDDINGQLTLRDFSINSEEEGSYTMDTLTVTCLNNEEGRHISVYSPPLKMEADGHFKWKQLYQTLLRCTHDRLPSVIPKAENTADDTECDMTFTCKMRDTTLIRRLANVQISIPEEATLEGNINSADRCITLNATAPEMKYNGNTLRDVRMDAECNARTMRSLLKAERKMKKGYVEMSLDAYATYDNIRTSLSWNNNASPAQSGTVNVSSFLRPGFDNRQTVEAQIEPSEIIINDTVWRIAPGWISYHDKTADVTDIKVYNDDRHVAVSGRLSANRTDTLTVRLKDVSLEYIFNIVNFHTVEFDGKATGLIYATSLFDTPDVDAYLHVQDMTFNDGLLGDADIYGNYGKNGKAITLNADINDAPHDSHTTVNGTVTPGRAPDGGLELRIDTRRINLYFLNKFTGRIFTNLQGRASGWTRVFGPFKRINMEGDLVVDDAELTVNATGTRYYAQGDTVTLRPNSIAMHNAAIYDSMGSKEAKEHSAVVDMLLTHDNLSKLRYNVDINATNLLCYNTDAKSGENFYGTAFATGKVHIDGHPGYTSIEVQATPNSGTSMVYNVASPETITDAGFISYVQSKDTIRTNNSGAADKDMTSDIHLDMNLSLNPEAEMKLIMNPRSGDYISIYGNGHILAKYYNKGKFQMMGTYRVEHGIYKLSMQDVIHKDFVFKEDGTIVFGGDPYEAALSLQATYTVPNVSLDDLSYSSLGLSNTRVDCVMNISGKPRQPKVDFDFDLPNANEDEKRMVKAMISTEEERNMQVMYLLGIGRFYSYGAQYAAKGGNQGGMAMNSLISSTLSSQFNQLISSAMGNNNWSFGTNLRTGETGWDQLDVEGMLSGRLLSGRLLLNGNFGYRESYYNNNNFIGDFDIQYVLNKAKTLSLKAYNQTNDRYFIQSSFTTQGVGLKFQKDFDHWKELFRRQKRKR